MSIAISNKPNASPNSEDKMAYGAVAEGADVPIVMSLKRSLTSGKKSSLGNSSLVMSPFAATMNKTPAVA